jgi:hypothetical protein
MVWTGVIVATAMVAVARNPARAQDGGKPMTLTALDYIEIQQLVAKYATAVVNCTNSGYDYADLYTGDGWFAPARDGKVGNRFQGRERLAEAAGGGKGGCREVSWREVTHVPTNHVITATPRGAVGRVDLVAVGVDNDPFKVERQGYYEDVYFKTPNGWRFGSRTHHLRAGQTVTPLNQQQKK